MPSAKSFLSAAALAAAVSVAAHPNLARADDVFWTADGDGVTWEDVLNWENEFTMLPQLPGLPDLAFINNAATINLSSAQNIGSFAIGHGTGVARLNILPGADLTVNNTSRIGRGTDAVGNARGEIWQTGGTLRFTSGNRRFGLTFDSRTAPEVNADSLYVISGGTLQIDGTGSVALGRTTNSAGQGISYNRAEFRVVGSGPSLINIGGDFVFEAGGTQGDPVARFEIDAGGVTKVTLGDELRLNPGAKLEIGVISSTVPTTDITLFEADRLTNPVVGEPEIFTGLPDMADVGAIFANRLYEWTIRYQDGADDGVIDAFVKLTMPRSFRGGDANKDGTVNLQDFNILASNFGQSGAMWTQADFNGDGIVNLADFNVLAGNFGLSASPNGPTQQDWDALGAAVVPEPTGAGALALAGLTLLARRRRAVSASYPC